MTEKLNPEKFNSQVLELYNQALEEAKQLLQSNPKGHYIHFPEWDDMFDARTKDDVNISVQGIGINGDGELCILAYVDNVGYGFTGREYPDEWVTLKEHPICADAFPGLYRFVAANMEEATPEPRNEDED